MLAPMRYKDFTWPNNPRTYTISYERQTAVHKVPQGAYTLEDLGRTCRVMRGEGEFYGPQAYETFKKLATVFYHNGPGVLLHPVWMTTSAYFTELQLRQEPAEDYVAYSFAFQEGYPDYQPMRRIPPEDPALTGKKYHLVAAGDTIWSIARLWDTTAAEILELNPDISNSRALTQGQKVRVR